MSLFRAAMSPAPACSSNTCSSSGFSGLGEGAPGVHPQGKEIPLKEQKGQNG